MKTGMSCVARPPEPMKPMVTVLDGAAACARSLCPASAAAANPAALKMKPLRLMLIAPPRGVCRLRLALPQTNAAAPQS